MSSPSYIQSSSHYSVVQMVKQIMNQNRSICSWGITPGDGGVAWTLSLPVWVSAISWSICFTRGLGGQVLVDQLPPFDPAKLIITSACIKHPSKSLALIILLHTHNTSQTQTHMCVLTAKSKSNEEQSYTHTHKMEAEYEGKIRQDATA